MKRFGAINVLAMVLMIFAGGAMAVDSAAVKSMFAEPPKEYSTAPFWVWNDMMTEEIVLSTLQDLASQGIRQVFVHPRPGLMTPYLSDEWFRLWKIALKEAERLGMNIWIYDENSYPSGFAGGFVPDAMPQSRGKGLAFKETSAAGKVGKDVAAAFRLTQQGYENVTDKAKAGELPTEANYLYFSIVHAAASPWFGGKFYVDLMKPGVTEKFLDITIPPYKQRFGDQFGKQIPGIFTDEPGIKPAGDLPWTDDLAQVFEKRWGYSLTENLPCIVRPVGDWKKARHNYFATQLELYVERWAKPYYEYCDKVGLEFTGHYWEHEWPNCRGVPDNMAMSAWQHRPGIDTLFNQYAENVHSQFGNIRAAMEISSLANQLGRKRTLCEVYGGGGWDLRFEDMKRIGDWLSVLGINTLNEHLSHVSIRGARKADYPQTFSYHEPWWEAYHVSARYLARLSAALSQGEQINTVLVIEPTTTAWMYQTDGSCSRHLEKIGAEFQRLVTTLAKEQVEFDLGCEDVIARDGSVEEASLKVGQRKYSVVVLPPLMENLNSRTAELLEQYVKAGGEVLCCGEEPNRIDGQQSQRCAAIAQAAGWKKIEPDELSASLLHQNKDGFSIRAKNDGAHILLHRRQKIADGEILFVINTSNKTPCAGVIQSAAQSIEQWDAEAGGISAYPFRNGGKGVEADFELGPCGSLLLFLSNNPGMAGTTEKTEEAVIAATGQMKIKRLGPSVLTLDYVDVNVGGQVMEQTYYHKAAATIFTRHGLDGNPWDHAIQFKDEFISRKFPAGSGFEAMYRFAIENQVPKSLWIVIERPDLYTITCNGRKVSAKKGQWWLDKSFGKMDIKPAAKVGENVVTIKASPFTVYHELAAAYVLGDFALKPVEKGFAIVADVPLKIGKWDEQGLPLYGHGVSYSRRFTVSQKSERYCVRLGDWYGSIAKVSVNGKFAGYIWHQPWQCDVTEHIKKGKNNIEVVVIGTLKNTLGPHHASPPLGYAGPDSFRKAPASGPPAGEKYHTVAYGLFEPFELVEQ